MVSSVAHRYNHAMVERAFVAAVGLVLGGCGRHAAPPPPPSGAAAPQAVRPWSIIVGRRDAIVEVDAGGSVVRTLARQPASSLAWRPGGGLVAEHDGLLRVLDVDGRVLRTISLPVTVTCAGQGGQRLFPQFGISVDPTGRSAAMTLAEASYDAENNVDVRVCLDTGSVHVDPGSLRGGCRVGGDVSLIAWPPPCAPSIKPVVDADDGETHTISDPAAARFAFHVVDGWVVRRDGAREERVAGPLLGAPDSVRVISISPSGRWALVAGPEFTSSSLYTYDLLVDRRTGDAWPLPTAASATWPAPLTRAELVAEPGHERPGGWLSYTETTRWYDADGDLLRAGSLLIRPGVRSFDLGGTPLDLP